MKEDFKNIIKQTVNNQSDDIDPDMIWSGIESKLGQKKKRRFAGYWIFGGLSLIVALLFFCYVWVSGDTSYKSSSGNYASDIQLTEKVNINRDVENEAKDKYKVVDKKNKEVAFNDKKEIELDNNKREINSGDNLINNQVLTLNKNVIRYQKINKNTSMLNTDVSNNEIGNDIGEMHIYENNVEAIMAHEIVSRESFIIPAIEQLKFSELFVNERVIEQGNHDDFVSDSPYEAAERSIRYLSGIEMYSRLSLGDKSVSDIDQSYATARNNSEQLLEQWSAGLRIDMVKVLDFQISSGVRYSMITDRFRMTNEYKDLTNFTYVQSRLMGDVIMAIDTVVVVDSISQNFKYTTEQYNSQRILTIPIGLSFGRNVGKFDLGIGFGVELNYQLADTHVILNKEGRPAVNKVGGNWVSPSFNGALMAGYHLNANWSITSRLNFSGLSLSDHDSISTLKSNYKLYGLELGIKRNFGE